MKFRGKVANNRLELLNRDVFIYKLQKLNNKNVVIEVKEEKSQRSLNQNAYYWGVVLDLLSTELGYTPQEMHGVLKFKFLQREIEFKNEKLRGTKSTTELNTKEFEEYLKNIRQWASTDLSIFIPEPNEEDYLIYESQQ